MGVNEKDKEMDVTDEERYVMRQCASEAFWYRSLPASLITGRAKTQSCCFSIILYPGLSVNYAIKTGKIKAKTNAGGWLVIVGASCSAYAVAKLSYILGKNCKDKFLQHAPDSEISQEIRKGRAKDKSIVKSEDEIKLRTFSEILDKLDLGK